LRNPWPTPHYRYCVASLMYLFRELVYLQTVLEEKILYLFSQEAERSEFSEEERQLSRKVINYWTNFARHG
jgi:hypothetical protein